MNKIVLLGLAIVAATAMTSVQAGDRGGQAPAFADIDANADGQITQVKCRHICKQKRLNGFKRWIPMLMVANERRNCGPNVGYNQSRAERRAEKC